MTQQQRHRLPVIVDALIAAASVALGIILLLRLEVALSMRLFDSKMLGSMAAFCTNVSPPSPRNFIVCSACALIAGVVLHLAQPDSETAGGLVAGLHLLLSKLAGSSFSPTIGLAVSVASKSWDLSSLDVPLRHLCTPWLAGHAFCYIFALAAAVPRRAARVRLVRREWQQLHTDSNGANGGTTVSRGQLRATFDRFDTLKDGRLDATEFKVATRAIAGIDLPIEDCEAVINSFDLDGNGSLDFAEFTDAVAPWCEPASAGGHWSRLRKVSTGAVRMRQGSLARKKEE